MKCRICGAELEPGTVECKYCGETVQTAVQPKKSSSAATGDAIRFSTGRSNDKKTETIPENDDAPDTTDGRTELLSDRPEKSKALFCSRCGRPLDGRTGKCIICDYREVGSRIYSSDTEYGSGGNMAKRKKKKKNTAKTAILAIIGLIVLFGLTFFIFFKLLGGSFAPSGEETKTEGGTDTNVTVTAAPSAAAQTSAPKATATPNVTRAPKVTEAPAVTSNPKHEAEDGDPAAFRGGSYIYDTHKKRIDKSTVETLADTREKARRLYYELYARYGMSFEDDDLIDYFESQIWYTPDSGADPDEIKAGFNDTEKYNEELIRKYMADKGWY